MPRPLLALVALSLAVACGEEDLSSAPAAQPPLLLARHPELIGALSLPEDSRGGQPVPTRIPLSGPFQLRRSGAEVRSFEAPQPTRLRSLFFIRPPDGMTLHRAGEEKALPFHREGRTNPRAGTWSFSARVLQVHTAGEAPPAAGDFELVYPRATEREEGLNPRWSGLTGADFALRTAWQDHTAREGVLLPAPGRISWRVTVPERGRLSMELGMLEPEVADLAPSEGARLRVLVAEGGQEREAGSFPVAPGRFDTERVDLSAWAGREVELSFVSDPGDDPRYDYVFVGEPSLYTPEAHPQRVVLVFIDTLRRDHVGWHGYERPTTPKLDAWAAGAVVFDHARSPAPWTLPTSRALLLGAEPEFWGVRPSLPERLGTAGWATAAFVGNVYLSANFEMADGWSHHFVENWPRATEQVERLERWLDEHDDQRALVMLHLMDTHLPYTEPRRYRKLWAPDPPKGLTGAFQRTDVLRAAKGKGRAAARQYVVDRYDGAIRYVDDQVAEVLESLGPDDVAVVFSDHGEEFWDHDGFEHGHTLYEELLAVPLAIRAPGLTAGRVAAPVSLTDLTPTLLELLGIAGDEALSGRSMLPLVRGEPSAVSAAEARLFGYGRPLYGDEQWGVLERELKYATEGGREELYDLDADPGEQRDLVKAERVDALPARREALGQALGTPAGLLFRLCPDRGGGRADLEVDLTVPGGVRAAWVGADPTEKSAAAVRVDGELVHVVWAGGHSGVREVFVAPLLEPRAVVPGLVLTARRGESEDTARWDPEEEVPEADGRVHRLLSVSAGGRLNLTWGVAPQPPEGGRELGGYDPETASALHALGYLDRDEEEEPKKEEESKE
ncbi:MAG: sulfatase-like hydrolase/transferase [Pseudomonadota bacterium]